MVFQAAALLSTQNLVGIYRSGRWLPPHSKWLLLRKRNCPALDPRPWSLMLGILPCSPLWPVFIPGRTFMLPSPGSTSTTSHWCSGPKLSVPALQSNPHDSPDPTITEPSAVLPWLQGMCAHATGLASHNSAHREGPWPRVFAYALPQARTLSSLHQPNQFLARLGPLCCFSLIRTSDNLVMPRVWSLFCTIIVITAWAKSPFPFEQASWFSKVTLSSQLGLKCRSLDLLSQSPFLTSIR